MTAHPIIAVPYHLDEYLPGLDIPLRAGQVVAADLPPGDVWDRLAILYGAVAAAVADTAGNGQRPVVVSGDCTTADGPLYLHVDLDVIDPAEVPGLRFPAPGGPGPAQVASALRSLLATGRVAAAGIACTWYPGHGAAPRVRPHLEAALAAGD